MSRRLILSKEMDQVISLVALECGVSDKEAVRKIFALALTVYKHTDSKNIKVSDEFKSFNIVGVR